MILTSHYMADVAALCQRILVIHHGRLLYDGDLKGLAQRIAPYKTVRVVLEQPVDGHHPGAGSAVPPELAQVVAQEPDRLVLRVPQGKVAEVTARVLERLPVADLNVEDPPIEEVIDTLFTTGQVGNGAPVGEGGG